MGKPCTKFLIFLLQVARESVSGTASHACYVWMCN